MNTPHVWLKRHELNAMPRGRGSLVTNVHAARCKHPASAHTGDWNPDSEWVRYEPTRKPVPIGHPRNYQLAVSRELDRLHAEAHKLAMAQIHAWATHIMEKHKNIRFFCMANGSVSFHEFEKPVTERSLDLPEIDERSYTKGLIKWIDDHDWTLFLTGTPLRIERTGPYTLETKTEW